MIETMIDEKTNVNAKGLKKVKFFDDRRLSRLSINPLNFSQDDVDSTVFNMQQ